MHLMMGADPYLSLRTSGTICSAYSRTTRQDPSIPGGGGEAEGARSPAADERDLLALLQASIHRMKDLHLQMDRMPQRIHTLRQQMRALLADFDR